MTRIGFNVRWQTGTLVHYVGNLLRALIVQGKEEFQFVCYGQEMDRQIVADLRTVWRSSDEFLPSRYGLERIKSSPKATCAETASTFSIARFI